MDKGTILDKEKRSKKNLDVVYLYRDGEGPWYIAREWSAYLMEFFPSGIDEKLSPKKVKSGDIKSGIISVSLKLSSLDKYMPACEREMENEELCKIYVDLKDYEEDLNIENHTGKLEEWKKTVEYKSVKKCQHEGGQRSVFSPSMTFTSIMKKILCFDTYKKDEAELREFVMSLKNDCSALI